MREIGVLDNVQQADLLADFLLSKGIKCHIDNDNSRYVLWALDDDLVTTAKEHLLAFKANPLDPVYADGAKAARQIRKEELGRRKQYRKNVKDIRSTWSLAPTTGPTFVSALLLSTCLIVGYLTWLGQAGNTITPWLLFSTDMNWTELKEGELWRLITPIFLHFGLMHILFNAMWLISLGPMIERSKGSLWLLGFVLITAIVSNFAQAYFVSPAFGGFSGVNYGLIGYASIMGRRAPGSGIRLSPQSAGLAIAWGLLGIAGEFVHHESWMANWAHGVGFAVGCFWAWAETEKSR